MPFLNKSVINRFHSAFEAASFLHKETEYERIPPLCYAFLGRMDSCMKYLNEHSRRLLDEEEIVLFFVYSCWILDGVKLISSHLHSSSAEKSDYKKKYNDIISKYQKRSKVDCRRMIRNRNRRIAGQKRYFRIKVDCRRFPSDSAASSFTVKIRCLLPDICEYESLDKCPCLLKPDISDDKFFEYLRSLIFAHPFETNRSSIFQIDEAVQESPFVIPEMPYHSVFPDRRGIVMYIYSGSGRSFDRRIAFSFSALKKYIRLRYSLINVATERIRQIFNEKKSQWKQRHVNRDLSPIDILKDIKLILDERSSEASWAIDPAIEYLSCKTTGRENDEIIQDYRGEIESIIPKLCDAVEEMNYEKMEKQLDEVLNAYLVLGRYPHYQMVVYRHEKIFDDLRGTKSSPELDSDRIACGLEDAEAFAKGFAKEWVIIKPYEMDFCEIRMLFSIACYYERMKIEGESDEPNNWDEGHGNPRCIEIVNIDGSVLRIHPAERIR